FVEPAGLLRLHSRWSRRTVVTVAVSACWGDSYSYLGIRSHAQPVIQIEQHCGTLRGGDQKVFESSKCMGTNRVPLVARDENAVVALVDENIEMIEPEISHHFVQLAFAINCPQQFRLRQFADNHPFGIP